MLPLQLIDHLNEKRILHHIIAFRGFADRVVRSRADAVVNLLDLERIRSLLAGWKSDYVLLIGVVHRPNAAALLSAYSLFANRHFVKDVISKGDDNLLRGAVAILEGWGHQVIGVHDVMPQIMAPSGVLGAVYPTDEDKISVETGFQLLHMLSPYDVGQAVALSGKRTLAVEGPEGTDRMLMRVKKLQHRFLSFKPAVLRGALVKTAKIGQDLRIDMPAIGPKTVLRAKQAGLNGIAVGAGSTLIVQQKETIQTADRLGLYLIGQDVKDIV